VPEPGTEATVPGSHSEHPTDDPLELHPNGQGSQELLPELGAVNPDGHFMHEVLPVEFEKKPASHAEHMDAPNEEE
jgi:hypothetical protein